jgi:hypothetical protein
MSTVQGLRAGIIAGILVGMTLTAGTVSAQGNFTTERPTSILIYPKVVNTADPDTIIQITNTSNGVTYAHCFYTDGRTVNGEPVWQVTDFELVLTRQQPTHWSVAQGRPVDPRDGVGGLDPGLIPPVPVGFTGFLVCVETAVDGTPVSANSLKGEATIGSVTAVAGASNVSKYNAIGIPACVSSTSGICGPSGGQNDGNNVLRLDGNEYAKCPGGVYLNFTAENASDPAIDGAGNIPSVVSTNLALVPCGMDFENLIPTSTALTVNLRNEFENFTSVEPIPMSCWFSDTLGGRSFGGAFSPLIVGNLDTTFGTAVLRPFTGSGDTPVVGVANVLRTAGDGSSDTAAQNLQFCTDETAPSSCVPFSSTIRLPSIK